MANRLAPRKHQIGRFAQMFREALPQGLALDSTRKIEVMGRSTPALVAGDRVLNLDCSIPDRFTADTGVTATVFARSEEDFVRISTSVRKQGGERAIGTTLSHAHPAYRRLLNGESYVGYATLFGKQYLTQYDALKDAAGRVIGALYVGIDVSDERSISLAAKIGLISFAVTAFIASTLVALFAGALTDGGAPNAEAVLASRNAYIAAGVIAAAIGAWLVYLFVRRALLAPLSQAQHVAQRLAGGDLTSLLHVDRNDEIGQVMQAINGISQGLAEIVGNVRAGAAEITAASSDIAAGNAHLSSRTSEQAAALEETSSSMAQLTAAVRESAENAELANSVVHSASEIAARGRRVVDQVIEMMNTIKRGSQHITEIVGEIEDIAFQTNILALNAAVEAARAGEHGRSFTVVAADVRNLAQRSGVAAKEIKAMISESVLQIDQGSALADEAGNTMNDVVSSFKRAADLMTEISSVSRQQSSGIEQVGIAVARMDEMTQHNAALVEEAAAAAESLQLQAERLSQAVAAFKLP